MKDFRAVSLDATKCIGCTHCMRKCPIGAIRVRDGKASIDYEKCIFCGNCIKVCPTHALNARYDTYEILNGYKFKVALLPSCLYGQFPHIFSPQLVLNSLKNIGFDHVYEVARASDILAIIMREKFVMKEFEHMPAINNNCPACVDLIQKRFPTLIDNLIDLLPPALLAAKLAREEAREISGLPDEDIGVFYISPCPAKVEAINGGMYSEVKELTGVLSVAETCKLLNPVDKNDVERTMDVKASNMGIAWCTSGGESSNFPNTKQLAVDGIENVISVLKEIEDDKLTNLDFAELYACHGGCVGGLLNITNTFVAKSKIHTLRKTVMLNKTNSTDKFDKPMAYYCLKNKPKANDVFKLDKDFSVAMEKMAKIEGVLKRLPHWDCGVCGSPTCRAFAEDVVNGKVELDKCDHLKEEK